MSGSGRFPEIEWSLREQIRHLREKISSQHCEKDSGFLSGPYSENLEGCDGNDEFPEDWAAGTSEYQPFRYDDEEAFRNLTCRPAEDPEIERKELTSYKMSKKELFGSSLPYLRSNGDEILLAASCVGAEAKEIMEDEITSGKLKKLANCRITKRHGDCVMYTQVRIRQEGTKYRHEEAHVDAFQEEAIQRYRRNARNGDGANSSI